MTDDLERMAEKAGITQDRHMNGTRVWSCVDFELSRFADLVRAEERAKVIAELHPFKPADAAMTPSA